MDTSKLLVIIAFAFGCANTKKPAQITTQNDSLHIVSAQLTDYFPGTGIGKGEHFKIMAVNNSLSTITCDSLQTKLHCIKFDGKPLLQVKDTLTINAYGLSIDYDLFPNIPKQQVKGDSSLVNGGIIYYTQGNKNKTMVIESFEKMASKFYE
jgi:hypothetical protein